MAKDSRYGAGPEGPTPPPAVLEDLDMLSTLEPIYRVFGQPDGRGMVIRSSEPVAFNPGGKLVNVVEVDALDDAMQHVTVATQSVGVYPSARIAEVRDQLRSEEHTSELQSLMRISYSVFCLKKKTNTN